MVDPLSGATLWSRSDITSNDRLFGDEQYILAVEVNRDGQAQIGRVFRAQDGVRVQPTADFAAAYQNRVRTVGRNILVWDAQQDGCKLRLYDPVTGKDVWKRDYPAGSTVTQTDDADLIGVVEPSGKVTALEVATNKDVLQTTVDPEHIKKVQSIALLQDSTQFYLLIRQPTDPVVNPGGGPYTNILPDTGIRSLPVNGMVYAFEKAKGKQVWRNEAVQQMLVLEHYEDLPFLLFTSRYQKPAGNGPGRFHQQVAAVKCIDKRSGKLLYDDPAMLNGPQFHALNVDEKEGKVELIGQTMKITLMATK
jgi:hypothetical protein